MTFWSGKGPWFHPTWVYSRVYTHEFLSLHQSSSTLSVKELLFLARNKTHRSLPSCLSRFRLNWFGLVVI